MLGHAKGASGSLVSPRLCLASFLALSSKMGRGGESRREPCNEARRIKPGALLTPFLRKELGNEARLSLC